MQNEGSCVQMDKPLIINLKEQTRSPYGKIE